MIPRPHAFCLAAVTLWGLSFVATKAVLAEVSPPTVVFTRFLMGAAFLFLLVLSSGRNRRLTGPEARRLLLMAFIGVFVHQIVQVFGLRWTSATSTGWLIGLTPIWSVLLATFFLSEALGLRRTLGLVLGLAGAVLIVGRGAIPDPLSLTGRGDLLVLATTVNWAVYTVISRRIGRHAGGIVSTTYMLLFGCLMLAVPFALSGGWRDYAGLSTSGWLNLLFLGIGCSGAGYLFWNLALEKLGAGQVSAYLYLEPFVTQTAAWWLLGEQLSAAVIGGGLTVLLGVYLVQTRAVPRGNRGV